MGGDVNGTEAWSLRVGGALPAVARKIKVGLQKETRLLARQGTTPILAEGAWGLGRIIAFASDEWGLANHQWRDLLSPALNDREVDLRVRLSKTDVILRGQPGMPIPSRPPEFRGQWGDLSGGNWRLEKPGVYASAIPAEVKGAFSVRVYSEEGMHDYAFDGRTEDEWVDSRRGRVVLKTLAEQSGGGFFTDAKQLSQVLKSRTRQGGLPVYYLLLLGGMLLILLSVMRRPGQTPSLN